MKILTRRSSEEPRKISARRVVAYIEPRLMKHDNARVRIFLNGRIIAVR